MHLISTKSGAAYAPLIENFDFLSVAKARSIVPRAWLILDIPTE